MVDACEDFGTLSTIFWFHPVKPGTSYSNPSPAGIRFVGIDTEMEKLEMDKRHPVFIHKRPLWRRVKGVLSTFLICLIEMTALIFHNNLF